MSNASTFQTLCEELKTIYLNPDTRRRHPDPIINLAEKIVKKFKKKYTLEKLDHYLDLELTIASNKQKYQSHAENILLTPLHVFFINKLWKHNFPPMPLPILNQNLIEQEENPSLLLAHQTALKLFNFIQKVMVLKGTRGGNYSSQRKAKAILILGELWDFYEIEKSLVVCAEGLKSKSEELVTTTANVLADYFSLRKISPTPDILSLIQHQIQKSKHEHVVRVCLNFLVAVELENPFNAEEKLRAWRKHY